MTAEIEPRKFRIGGNVSPDPFPQALYNLACSRGYESQYSLTKALCKKDNATVGSWYSGKTVPIPDQLGKILRLLKPNDQELDTLLEPYGKLLQEGKGRNDGNVADSDSARRIGIKRMRPPNSPFEGWVKRFCQEKKLTIKKVAILLGFNPHNFGLNDLGIQAYSKVLQNAQKALDLSEEETADLGDAIAETIQREIAEGHKFTGNLTGMSLKKIQRELACTTYTGQEAAESLGITRERVRQLREKFGLPLLLTENHIDILRKRRQWGEKLRRK